MEKPTKVYDIVPYVDENIRIVTEQIKVLEAQIKELQATGKAPTPKPTLTSLKK